jgi:hypothetical protein
MTQTLNHEDAKASDFAGPCPRCGGAVPNEDEPGVYPGALSRFDNETMICSNCGTQEAFGAGHMIPFSIDLHSDEAAAIRKEIEHHDGTVDGLRLVCSCGWSTTMIDDALAHSIFRSHILTAGSANFAHGDERHDNGALSDIKAWAALGCRPCKEKVSA